MLLKNLLTLTLAVSTCCSALPCKTENAAVGECLQSALKVYTTFVTPAPADCGRDDAYTLTCAQGSAVIYRIDGENTYILTNYHVVFLNNADETVNGGKTAREIYCYLYGSEGSPAVIREKDDIYGYPICDFGEYGIKCEYAGGSITADLALLKANTSDLKAINEHIREVTFADGYSAGETAIAIGNTEGEGISVTRGIVSVENEYILLQIDGTPRYYRSLRIDTPIYHGNSGGGLFNTKGELIGITNAGSLEKQNINYAIPVELVRGVAGNLLDYYLDGDPTTFGAYAIKLGMEVSATSSRYEFDAKRQTGHIVEEVCVTLIEENSIAKALGLAEDDIITDLIVNKKAHKIERSFDISDILLTVRAGDTISVKFLRDGEKKTSAKYSVSVSDLAPIA
ncbi:MAG: S1C family serine protease [Clostridia bacterium]|nr:S1C family serine protease [Clostridia bacterium]